MKQSRQNSRELKMKQKIEQEGTKNETRTYNVVTCEQAL